MRTNFYAHVQHSLRDRACAATGAHRKFLRVHSLLRFMPSVSTSMPSPGTPAKAYLAVQCSAHPHTPHRTASAPTIHLLTHATALLNRGADGSVQRHAQRGLATHCHYRCCHHCAHPPRHSCRHGCVRFWVAHRQPSSLHATCYSAVFTLAVSAALARRLCATFSTPHNATERTRQHDGSFQCF